MCKKVVSILLCLVITLALLFTVPVSAETIIVSNPDIGEGVIYHTPETAKPIEPTPEPEPEPGDIDVYFDKKTGTLTVSGSGKAYDIFGRNNVDLFDFLFPSEGIKNINHTVKHLVIGEGITEIHNCFNDMYALEDVSFPSTLERIDFCFIDCDLLKKVIFPKSLKVIEEGAFYDCDGIKRIKFSGPLTVAEEFPEKGGCETYVFRHLDSLKYVKIPANSVVGAAFKDCQKLKTVVFKAKLSPKNFSTSLSLSKENCSGTIRTVSSLVLHNSLIF